MAQANNYADSSDTRRWRTPACDISEESEAFQVLLDLPGVTEKDLDVTFERGNIQIIGRVAADELRQYKPGRYEYAPYGFRRSFSLSDQIDSAGIQAKLTNGVLNLTLPKADGFKPRRITVKAE